MIIVMLLFAAVLIGYWVLLGRISAALQARQPALYAEVGGTRAEDFLMIGFVTGDGLISRLEKHQAELTGDFYLKRMVSAARALWGAQIVLTIAGFIVIVN